jgi:O-methyltransferase involved in polyketide biosynthesis
MIEKKNRELAGEKPRCELRRVGVDLADDGARSRFLGEAVAAAQKALVLTEGVIPYLTEGQVAALATDLRAHGKIRYWIAEYVSPRAMRFIQTSRRQREMRNAPFKFNPKDWWGFFEGLGWGRKLVVYTAEESVRLGRPVPMPWWARIFRVLGLLGRRKEATQFTGYALFEPR